MSTTLTPLVYDTFIFRDELDLLEIRLAELWDVVDRFVLVEARENFRGRPKPLFYSENKSRFDRWNSKIDCIVIDTYPMIGDFRPINFQRQTISRNRLGSYPFPDNAIVIHSDADEICRAQLIRDYLSSDCALSHIEMDWFHYFLNCKHPQRTKRTTIGHAAIYEDHGFDNVRWKIGPINKCIHDGGWHFSYLGDVHKLLNKINAASDGGKSDWVNGVSLDTLQERIDQGKLYDGSLQFEFVGLYNLPRYVQENADDFIIRKLIRLQT